MEKINIRALILDYGGVISQPQNPDNVNNILQIINQDYDDFMYVYQSHRAGYDSAHLSGQEYWTKILQHYDLVPNDYEIERLIQEDVSSWTHLNESMIEFIKQYSSGIPKLAVISNMTTDCLVTIKSQFEWFALFDELIFSCDVGVNKPEKEIYEICLRQLKVSPNECLFVDDSASNVNGALRVGMHGMQFKSFAQFTLELDDKYNVTQ